MKRTTAAAGCLALMIAACGGVSRDGDNSKSEPTEEVGRVTSAIQGGQTTTSYPYVLGLFSTSVGGLCTGTLIAPNLVLTARHCIDGTSSESVDCARSKFTRPGGDDSIVAMACADVTRPRSCVSRYRSTKLVRTPGTSFCGNDMALVILDENIPATVATPVIPAVELPIYDKKYNRTITAIGYGATDAEGDGAGVKRILENISVACVPNHPNPNYDCFKVAPGVNAFTANEFIAGSGTCSGDSGSSAFEQGSFNHNAPVTLGVLSRGGVDGSTCASSLYTRTDSWRDLIIATALEAATLGGYTAPAWTAAKPFETPDAGTPAPKGSALGEACSDDGQCASGLCAVTPGSGDGAESHCTVACDDENPCEEGYACLEGARDDQAGLCLVAPVPTVTSAPVATTPAAQPSGSDEGQGCSVARDPGKPIPWRGNAVAVTMVGLALGLTVRRRRQA